jgi:hypothetical protein
MTDLVRVSGTRVVTPVGSTVISSTKGGITLAATSTNVTGVVNIARDANIYGNIKVAGTTSTVIIRADDSNVDNHNGFGFDPNNKYGSTEDRLTAAVYVAGGVGIEKDLNVGGYIYGRVSQANTSLQLVITSTNIDHVFYPIFTDTPNGGGYIYSDTAGTKGGLTYNPFTGRMTMDQLNIASTSLSYSSTTGAVTVVGGVGIGGNMYVGDVLPNSQNNLGSSIDHWNNGYIDNIYTNVITANSSTVIIEPSLSVTQLTLINNIPSVSTTTGSLVVEGGIGVGGSIWTGQDINVNGLTIGQGYQGQNNIVIQGVASPEINQFPNGQESIAIGYNTLGGISTSYNNFSLGNYSLSSGTNLTNNFALGNHTLEVLGTVQDIILADITGATNTNPVVITAADHGITNGSAVIISNVLGMTALNGQTYYANIIDSNSLSLYFDNILNQPVDGSSFGSYISGGIIYVYALIDSNTAIGNNAGNQLINGEENFLLGNNAGSSLISGSYNVLVGHDAAINLITGNSNVSINGDNLVDGRDNQVNIGPVFYYDGLGNLQLSADTLVGLGIESTSFDTGSLVVNGGLGVDGNIYLTCELYQTGLYGGLNVKMGSDHLNSYAFNGTSDHLENTTSNSLYFLGNDFTIEMWVNFNVGNTGTIFASGSMSAGTSIALTTGSFSITNLTASTSSNWVVPSNTWSHIAVSRQDGIVYGFVNGVLANSFTYSNSTGTVQLSAGSVDQWAVIGADSYNPSSNFFNGYLSNLRVISGEALYTSNFNVPTHTLLPLVIQPDVTTVLLTAQDKFIIDNSPNQLILDSHLTVPRISSSIVPSISTATVATSWNYNPIDDSWGSVSAIKTFSTSSAVSTATGALTVSGGAGIGKDLYVGGTIYGAVTNLANGNPGDLPYQSTSSQTSFLPIGPDQSILTVQGTNLVWQQYAGISSLANNSFAAQTVFVNEVGFPPLSTSTFTTSTYYVDLSDQYGSYADMFADPALTYDSTAKEVHVKNVNIVNTATVGVSLNMADNAGIYSTTYGNPDENNLIYTPRILVSGTLPTDPRVGDYWVDTTSGIEYQYVASNGTKYWVQFSRS